MYANYIKMKFISDADLSFDTCLSFAGWIVAPSRHLVTPFTLSAICLLPSCLVLAHGFEFLPSWAPKCTIVCPLNFFSSSYFIRILSRTVLEFLRLSRIIKWILVPLHVNMAQSHISHVEKPQHFATNQTCRILLFLRSWEPIIMHNFK